MMPALVTVEQVNNALRLGLDLDVGEGGDTERLDDITLKINQAEDIVLDYLKTTVEEKEWTPEAHPARVSAAIILVIRCLLDDSEESTTMLSGLSGTIADNPRNPIVALLWRLRDPTLA